MKKNRLFMMAGALCAALGLGSCSNEMDEVAVPAEGATRTVTLTVSLPDRGADTRTAYAPDGAGLKMTWAEGDKLTAVYDRNFAKSTTFTLTSGAGETTGTFTGDLPADVAEGDPVSFFYPKFKTEVIDGETHYICPDYTAQDGTLAGLSKVDGFYFKATYSDGKLSVNSSSTYRYTSFLHFAKDTKVASTGGTATFTISGASGGYDYSAGKIIEGDIVVSGNVNSDGTLAADVYIAFEPYDPVLPTLTITIGTEEKVYSLDRNFVADRMYNISDMSKLTEIKVGMVIGSDGKYYANKATAEAVEGVTAEAMIAYVGTEAEGAAHGLAIALEDASSELVTWDNAATTVSTWSGGHAVPGGTWRLPSAYDWQRMFIGCYSTSTYVSELKSDNYQMKFFCGNFLINLEAASGESEEVNYYYWSSTEYDSDNAWFYYFNNNEYDINEFYYESKGNSNYVRAVLAF